jgi:putative NADH-flavin reductase
MNIAILGATGNVGSRLVHEALTRGHEVTGLARNPTKLPAQPHLRLVAADSHAPALLARLLAGYDAIISSLPFRTTNPDQLIEAVRRSGVARFLVVGGASTLEVAPGKLLIDTPQFPEAFRAEAEGGRALLKKLRAVSDVDWTMLCPSAIFTAGERTGVFRLGEDTLLTAADGKSWISFEDYAIAMLDEIELPAHVGTRFTVGY